MAYVPRRVPDTQLRLITLYALKRLGSCFDSQLLDFLTDLDLMNYFDMMLSLIALSSDGQVVRTARADRSLYSLTPAGEQTMSLLSSHLPESIRLSIDEKSSEAAARYRREQEFITDLKKIDSLDYQLNLSVMDQDTKLMNLTLSLPDESLAEKLRRNWPAKAGAIYAHIIKELSEEPS